MTRRRPYMIVAGDDRILRDRLTDRRGRPISLEPFDSVTFRAERTDGPGYSLDVEDGESYTIGPAESQTYESGETEQGGSLTIEQGGSLTTTGSERVVLAGSIEGDEVVVDLNGQIDEVGGWRVEWELEGTDRLRTVPGHGTIPLVARPPLLGTTLSVDDTESHTIASGGTESYDTTSIEQGGSLTQEQGSTLETTGTGD